MIINKEEDTTSVISIDKFENSWWVQNILSHDELGKDRYEIDYGEFKVLPVNVLLFLKWLLSEISNVDGNVRKRKFIIQFSLNPNHLDYVAALTCKLQSILSVDSCEPELREELLESENFSHCKPFWPVRWFTHLYWKRIELPNKLWELEQVELVDFSAIYFKSYDEKFKLPCAIGKFKELKYLILRCDHLDSLPLSLSFCKNLERLDIIGNFFTKLPLFLNDMPNLKSLNRTGNRFYSSKFSYDPEIFKSEDEHSDTCKPSGVTSLTTLASRTICKEQLITPELLTQFNIPKHLKQNIMEELEAWVYCWSCKKGLSNNEANECFVFLQNLAGSTDIPVFCHACSSCITKVESYIKTLNCQEFTTQTQVHVNKVSIANLHSKNCSRCRRNIFERFLSFFGI